MDYWDYEEAKQKSAMDPQNLTKTVRSSDQNLHYWIWDTLPNGRIDMVQRYKCRWGLPCTKTVPCTDAGLKELVKHESRQKAKWLAEGPNGEYNECRV